MFVHRECESTAGRDHGMGWEAKGKKEFVRGLVAASHAFCDVWLAVVADRERWGYGGSLCGLGWRVNDDEKKTLKNDCGFLLVALVSFSSFQLSFLLPSSPIPLVSIYLFISLNYLFIYSFLNHFVYFYFIFSHDDPFFFCLSFLSLPNLVGSSPLI